MAKKEKTVSQANWQRDRLFTAYYPFVCELLQHVRRKQQKF